MLLGYDARKISNWEVDNAIKSATRANVRAYAYPSQGTTFYCITDGTTFSYEFNCQSGRWHQRKGSSLEFAQTIDATVFNNGVIFGDYTAAELYSLDTTATPAAASVVSMSFSRDNGTSFSTPRTKTIGTSGQRTARVKFNRLGQSKEDGFVLKVQITSAYVEDGSDIDITIIPPALVATPYPVQIHAVYVDSIPGTASTALQKGMIQMAADIGKVAA